MIDKNVDIEKPKGGFIPILAPLLDILFKRGSGSSINMPVLAHVALNDPNPRDTSSPPQESFILICYEPTEHLTPRNHLM